MLSWIHLLPAQAAKRRSEQLERLLPNSTITEDVQLNSVPHHRTKDQEYFASLDYERRLKLLTSTSSTFSCGNDVGGYL